ncbi:MAG: 4-hydroxythreonine-4-phosphate dehydrogenase PdxA [Pseudomonadota bacterium]
MNIPNRKARLAVSVGEPAGIGPDIAITAALESWPADLVLIADRTLLEVRAETLGLSCSFVNYEDYLSDVFADARPRSHQIPVLNVPMRSPCKPGETNPDNSAYVLEALTRGTTGCLDGEFAALITAPIHKAAINEAGFAFTGHTEFLASLSSAEHVVMLLASKEMRVALATTHLPLNAVPAAITPQLLEQTLKIIRSDFVTKFGIAKPRISVLGLNPHAGEDGHLGREEIEIIEPAIKKAQREGMDVSGPWPADTAFNPKLLSATDVYLAMFHDQGLPVLKYASFGAAVNISLGLPFTRISVDHGTALELAGTGRASAAGMLEAIRQACSFVLP